MDKQNEALRLAELRRLGAAEVDSQRAIKTLQQAGYTDCGGELWKPPLGNAPDFGLEMPEAVATVTNNFRSDYSEIGRTYEAPIAIGTKLVTTNQLRETVAAAVLREREACAKVCDEVYYENIGPTLGEVRHGIAACAAAIRNRSKAMNAPAKSPI